jgi:hypothetical protein
VKARDSGRAACAGVQGAVQEQFRSSPGAVEEQCRRQRVSKRRAGTGKCFILYLVHRHYRPRHLGWPYNIPGWWVHGEELGAVSFTRRAVCKPSRPRFDTAKECEAI